MKKILITGVNSYIGVSFENYINKNYPNDFEIDTVDMIGEGWKNTDFSGYDCVFHVAGLAHQKETKENAELYYKVNRDLAVETAIKAKNDGVKQFIFLSTMSVYGLETGVITRDTLPAPKSNYGKSKLQAEQKIEELNDTSFKVSVIRPPMVYGKNCKGNFQTVVKLVRKFPLFPKLKNERSMIYIDNLCEFVKIVAEKEKMGLFFPQNKEYVRTDDMAEKIAEVLNKKVFFSMLAGWMLVILRPYVTVVKKAFGSLIYNFEEDEFDYHVVAFDESVKESV